MLERGDFGSSVVFWILTMIIKTPSFTFSISTLLDSFHELIFTELRQAHLTSSCWHLSFVTFIQHGPKDCQIVIDRGAVPASASELMLALLNADLYPLCNTGHDFHVVPTESELFGNQTWDAATEDRLSAQWWVLVAHCQWPKRTYRPHYISVGWGLHLICYLSSVLTRTPVKWLISQLGPMCQITSHGCLFVCCIRYYY